VTTLTTKFIFWEILTTALRTNNHKFFSTLITKFSGLEIISLAFWTFHNSFSLNEFNNKRPAMMNGLYLSINHLRTALRGKEIQIVEIQSLGYQRQDELQDEFAGGS
jgi:hypothetical protein